MTLRNLDVVVSNEDRPAHGLKRGEALVTLPPSAVRDVADDDLVAVRPATSGDI